jgi:hypothetical protein
MTWDHWVLIPTNIGESNTRKTASTRTQNYVEYRSHRNPNSKFYCYIFCVQVVCFFRRIKTP